MKQFAKLILLLSICCSFSLHAFKIDTHVWVGQQVLNDLEDGYLTFQVGDKEVNIKVREELKETLIKYQDYYRAGNIGPDMAPDVIVGQSLIHTEDIHDSSSWNTSDWLKFLWRQAEKPEEKAFVMGFMSHAAADIFAHTYVNRYAGDIFDLTDGELDVEIRHILMEGMISQYTPKFPQSQDLEVPVDFIRDKIIFNDEAQDQFEGTAGSHLFAMYALRKEVKRTAESTTWLRMKREIVQYIAEYYDIPLTDDQAEKISIISNKIHRYSMEKSEELQKALSDLEKTEQYVHKFEKKATEKAHDALLKGMDELTKALDKLDNIESDILDLAERFSNTPRRIEEKYLKPVIRRVRERECKTHPIKPPHCWNKWKEVTDWVEDFRMIDNPAFDLAKRALEDAQKRRRWLHNEARDQVQRTKDAASAFTGAIISVLEARLATKNAIVDIWQQYSSSNYPFQSFFEAWVKNIDMSTHHYVANMNKAMMVSTVDKAQSKALVSEWVKCYALGLTNVPVVGNETACKINDTIEKVDEAIDKLNNLMPDAYLLNKLKAEKDRLIEKAKSQIINHIARKLAGNELYHLFKELKAGYHEPALRKAFIGNTFSNKGLLTADDVVERMKAEMYIGNKDHFDQNRFAAAYNAVVLAKLTLLNDQELNEFVRKSSSEFNGYNTIYGPELFTDVNQILFDAVRSLDGNHQWQEIAPNNLRRIGFPDKPDEERRFGYAFNQNDEGFRLWQDPKAKEKIFNKLFKHPIVPGIDAPELIGFGPIADPELIKGLAFDSDNEDQTDEDTINHESKIDRYKFVMRPSLSKNYELLSDLEFKKAFPNYSAQLQNLVIYDPSLKDLKVFCNKSQNLEFVKGLLTDKFAFDPEKLDFGSYSQHSNSFWGIKGSFEQYINGYPIYKTDFGFETMGRNCQILSRFHINAVNLDNVKVESPNILVSQDEAKSLILSKIGSGPIYSKTAYVEFSPSNYSLAHVFVTTIKGAFYLIPNTYFIHYVNASTGEITKELAVKQSSKEWIEQVGHEYFN